jgi:apolipoprotein N-acyltransferase
MLYAAVLRIGIEAVALAALRLAPARLLGARRLLEGAGRVLYYLLVPAWLLLRVLGE